MDCYKSSIYTNGSRLRKRPYICIAGKNNIAVNVLEYIVKHYGKNDLCVVCNKTETGENNFQRSVKKYANMLEIPVKKLEEIYKIPNLVFLSLEFDQIIKPSLFNDARLYNIHFSVLPKYKGMYTSAHPILNGEKYSGVTLHKIDSGIDTGDIIDQEMFEILDCDCKHLYLNYIEYGTKIVVKNIDDLIWDRVYAVKQKEDGSSYYSKKSISYDNIHINLNDTAEGIQRQLRAYSFRDYQLPHVFDKAIIDSTILNQKSLTKPGNILFKNDLCCVVSTVDYNIALYYDRFDILMNACQNGDVEKVISICTISKHINEQDKHGWSPLIKATYFNHYEIVSWLISQGADIHAVNRNGTNLLMYAKEAYKKYGDNRLYKLYKKLGLSEYTLDYSGCSLIYYIAKEDISLDDLNK